MIRLKNKKFLLFMIGIISIFVASTVYAATTYTVVKGHTILFYSSNGVYTEKSGKTNGTKYKSLNGKAAYCTQLGKQISNNNFSVDSSFNTKSSNALIAGKAIEIVNGKSEWSSDEKYLYITELMNYTFKYDGYYNYVDKNSELKNIYNTAKSFVSGTAKYSGDAASKLPTISLTSEASKSMNSTSASGTYISNKITLKGLVANYGSGNSTNNGDTTYKISVSASSGTATICTKAAGTNCSSTVTLSSPKNESASYYIRVDGASAGGSVKVSVTGSNKSTYPTVTQYKSNSASQILVLAGTVTLPRSVSTSLNLSIPGSAAHTIVVNKVDEDGNDLTGASLELYKAGDDDKQIGAILQKNSNGAASFSYAVTNSEDADDFFDYKYCVRETSAPSGYVLLANSVCVEPTNKESEVCLNQDGESMDDLNYCGASYSCSAGELSKDENGNFMCVVTNQENPEVTYTCPDDTYNLDGSTCKKNNSATFDETTQQYSCPDGSLPVDSSDGSKICSISISASPNDVCDVDNGFSLSNGVCIKTEKTVASCVGGKGNVDSKYCQNVNDYTLVYQDGNNVNITKVNHKTEVSISKKDATGENEVPGAKLKICSDKPDSDGNCTVVSLEQKGLSCPTYNDELNESQSEVYDCAYDESTDTRTISLSWVSTDVPKTWSGLEIGKTYYLVEDTPPKGYIGVTTTTEFVINSDGSVTSSDKEVENNVIIINNELTEMSVSKKDFVTSKEIEGATLSICQSHIDDDGDLAMSLDDYGNCTVVTLADGTAATWVSDKEPHKIEGLAVGTYYLVEIIAPDGYNTAESVIFTMNSDGTVSDENGKKVGSDNKIVMYDEPIEVPPTGDLPIILLVILVATVSGWIYHTIKVNNNQINSNTK